MAALTLNTPTRPGAVVTPAAASASDTISRTVLGERGANLRIATAGTASNVTVSDSGTTPAGNPATVSAVAMGATQVKTVFVSPKQVDSSTGLVTITNTSTVALTYEVYPA